MTTDRIPAENNNKVSYEQKDYHANPFFGYVPDQPASKYKWLSGVEIEKIMAARIDKPGVILYGIRFLSD